LKDYFSELETLQDALVQVKVLADGMASKNREANVKLGQTESELKITKENLARKSKRCEDLKQKLDDYRDNTQKLVYQVEADLSRIQSMANEDLANEISGVKHYVRTQTGEYMVNDVENSPSK